MATPVISQLPVPPNRADAAADFSIKADVFVASLPPFVLQMNTAVTWMAATMATVLDYKSAAANSASAAADSATLAGQQVGLATDQATLATNAKNAAAASATNAAASATAAEASSGSIGNLALLYAVALSF